MKIRLNGEAYELERSVTITELLRQLDIDPRRVAVERNIDVVKRSAYDDTLVQEGDEIEVVHLVGGGRLPRVADSPDSGDRADSETQP